VRLPDYWRQTFPAFPPDEERLKLWLPPRVRVSEVEYAFKAAVKRIKKVGPFESAAHLINYVQRTLRNEFQVKLPRYIPPIDFKQRRPGDLVWFDMEGRKFSTKYYPVIEMEKVGDWFWAVLTPAMRKLKTSFRQTVRLRVSHTKRQPKLIKAFPWLPTTSFSFMVEDRLVDGIQLVGVKVTRVI